MARFHMCPSFTNAHAETMTMVLDYIENKYVARVSQYLRYVRVDVVVGKLHKFKAVTQTLH